MMTLVGTAHNMQSNAIKYRNPALLSHAGLPQRGLIKAATPKVFFPTSAMKDCRGRGRASPASAKTNRLITPNRPMVVLDK